MKYYENSTEKEKAVLVGVDDGRFDINSSLEELRLLAESAGATVLCSVVQKRESPNTAFFIGTGRLEEIRDYCEKTEVDLLIFDAELTAIQVRNIEAFTSVRTIDRNTLILDIFALRAKSREGRLQVELAQMNYLLPRLVGKGTALSRLGGGIGTRGPGETKLETDRRHIRRRIHALEEELKNVEKQRELRRKRRKHSGILTCAIVGYTNAGKSTLLNQLTNSNVLAQDMLFCTLDPTSRVLQLPHGSKILLTDTVGFVSRLPHSLVEAFHSTLEEAADADLILNVCDASSPELEHHISVTSQTFEELGILETPTITVLNKIDQCKNMHFLPFSKNTVCISAKTGEGIDRLLSLIETLLPYPSRRMELLIPYTDGGKLAKIREIGSVFHEEYNENGIRLTVELDARYASSFMKYLIEN